MSRAQISSLPPSAPVSPEAFREACAHFASGVAIATTRDPLGNPHGLTISSFTPVSLDPPLVLICVDSHCALLAHFRSSAFFAVNILEASQRALSEAFALKPDQRFDNVDWSAGVTAAPLLAGSLATIECRKTRILEAGDHGVVFGEVVAAAVHSGRPLVYFHRAYRALALTAADSLPLD